MPHKGLILKKLIKYQFPRHIKLLWFFFFLFLYNLFKCKAFHLRLSLTIYRKQLNKYITCVVFVFFSFFFCFFFFFVLHILYITTLCNVNNMTVFLEQKRQLALNLCKYNKNTPERILNL